MSWLGNVYVKTNINEKQIQVQVQIQMQIQMQMKAQLGPNEGPEYSVIICQSIFGGRGPFTHS